MPLASFPSTFNLTELKKGFFPHLFNTPDHQQYVGRIPDLEFYDPDGIMAKKKDELTRWHADQIRRNVSFHFRQGMIDYCKSDVALLKAGCETFQQEFERQTGFNPMAKCITIASVGNLYWRKHHLTPDTIVVEPLEGGGGVARREGQPIPQGPAMALLPRTPNSQGGGQCRPHPTRP